jgi:hypothetical protein
MTYRIISYDHERPFLSRALYRVSGRWPNHKDRYDSSGHSFSDREAAVNLIHKLGGPCHHDQFLDDRDRQVIRLACRQASGNPTFYLEAYEASRETMTDIERALTHLKNIVEQSAPIAIEAEPIVYKYPVIKDRIVESFRFEIVKNFRGFCQWLEDEPRQVFCALGMIALLISVHCVPIQRVDRGN